MRLRYRKGTSAENQEDVNPRKQILLFVGSFAEFERAMLRERTKSGLDAARKEGRIGGRRPKLTKRQQEEIVSLVTATL